MPRKLGASVHRQVDRFSQPNGRLRRFRLSPGSLHNDGGLDRLQAQAPLHLGGDGRLSCKAQSVNVADAESPHCVTAPLRAFSGFLEAHTTRVRLVRATNSRRPRAKSKFVQIAPLICRINRGVIVSRICSVNLTCTIDGNEGT